MDFRFEKLSTLSNFSDKEKEIYKYMLEKFNTYTDLGNIYHHDKELDFDFVEPTDQAVIEDTAKKFKLSTEEVDRIFLAIETSMAKQ